MVCEYMLGTQEASEQLIKDLYIDLRNRVNYWSEITQQTPQARMGYIGQHLVSVVTSIPGGKSGARGYDLVLPNQEYAEIKSCYRVDQLGVCKNCGSTVSSIEKNCSLCNSTYIERKDDSKWLISIRNEDEFRNILSPKDYYFVLFEFEEILDVDNNNVILTIWKVDPKNKGFAYCLIDYYLNIRSASKSKAPFNMWPHQFKFAITKPSMIYKSKITAGDVIETILFPSGGNVAIDELPPLTDYSRSTTITVNTLKDCIAKIDNSINVEGKNKAKLLSILETLRLENNLSSDYLCDLLATAVYLPLILPQVNEIPDELKRPFPELQ